MTAASIHNLMLRKAGLCICLIIVAISISVLAGWKFDIKILETVVRGFITMKANSAILMLLSGVALALLFLETMKEPIRICVILIAISIIAISILTLSEDLFGWDLGIDQLIFLDMHNTGESTMHGRMSPSSAYCYVLIGIALLAGCKSIWIRYRRPIIAAFGVTIFIVGVLALSEQILYSIYKFNFWSHAGVTLDSAIGFILLGIALPMLIFSERKIRWYISTFNTSVFVVAILALLGIASQSFYFINKLQQNITLVAETQGVLVEIGEVVEDASILEDGRRGYIITGDVKLLADRDVMKAMIKNDLNEVDALVPDHSAQQIYIDQIRELLTRRMQWEDQTILEHNLHGSYVEAKTVNTDEGAKITTKINIILAEMKENQRNLLSQYKDQANASSARTFLLLPLQVFVSLTILIFGLFLLNNAAIEHKQVEEQLRQSQKMEAIGQLTGGVAHDFNNLLGVMFGNLDLLESLVIGNEEAVKRIQTVQMAAERGADLTKRLLAFSRLQQLNPEPISLTNSIDNMIEMASRLFGPEIKLIKHLDQSMPLVFVDASGLESALLNLAVNARDAMPKGGTITISTQLIDLGERYMLAQDKKLKPGNYARILISDTGQGMSKETLARVFEPFFTTKAQGKGTGLGLSMVYGFVTQSEGLINIYSELNHGTTVTIYLPLAKDNVLKTKAITTNNLLAKADGTVLVVDDDADLLEVAIVFLEGMGYKVLHAKDGPSAIIILEREPNIDLLVTDVIMSGGINGVELSLKARQLKPNIKIVYSSGFPAEALSEKNGLQINAPLLHKPYHKKDFIKIILSLMEP